jgi:outer membrane autotransporter protein
VAETPNQIATAEAVEGLGAGNAVYDALLQQDVDSITGAFDALSGEVHATVQSALLDDTRHARDSALARLVGPREAGSGVWARSYGELSSADGDGNAASQQRAAAGLFAGVDGSVEGYTLGALAGYGQSSLAIDERSSSALTDVLHLGVYGGTQSDALQLRAGAGLSHAAIGTERTVEFTGLSEDLAARYGALLLHGFAEVGYSIEAGPVTLEPFANLAHARIHTDGFTEAGGDAALRGDSAGFDSTLATIGVRASGDFRIAERDVSAHGTIAWQQAFGTAPASTHQFIEGEAFTVDGVPVAGGALLLDLGVDIPISEAASMSFSYGGQLAAGSSSHTGRLGLQVSF